MKSLFYNIQQIGFYCDFTLESAQQSFSKVTDYEKARLVLAERRNTSAQWKFMLNEQIKPLRWNLLIWTRFNIAESAV